MASTPPEPYPGEKADGVSAITQPQSSTGDPSAQWLSALPLSSVPDHELLRCIGRGAYGAVWLARNVMGTYRAVKLVHGADFARERPFLREYEGLLKYEPISRSHPNLMQILHVGRHEGFFYYVTELSDDANGECGVRSAEQAEVVATQEGSGQAGDQTSPTSLMFSSVTTYVPRTLQEDLARRRRLPVRECLRVAVALASALKHLHDHQLIHRDVKPSNVIFVHGVPKLADIGLVATVGDSRSIVGTEGYLAPEGPGNPQADLYALGKLLYEASTGMSRGDYPRLPQNLRGLPDAKELLEFNEVLLKTCARDTERRYHSADELLADLALLERGDSVKRLRRLERHQVLLKRVGVAALVAGLLVSAAWWQSWRGQRIANRNLALLLVDKGTQRMVDGDYAAALPWLVGALQLDSGSPDRERAHRMRIASVLARCPRPVARFYVPESKALSADLSPDGSMLATAHEDGMVRLWNSRTGQETRKLPHDWPVVFCQFLPTGDRMLTGTVRQEAYLWDLARPLDAPRVFAQAFGASAFPYSVGLNQLLGRAYLSKGRHIFARFHPLIPEFHPLTNSFENLALVLSLAGKGNDLLVQYEIRNTAPGGEVLYHGDFLDTPKAELLDEGLDNPPTPLWGPVILCLENSSVRDVDETGGRIIWDNVRVRRFPSGELPPPWRVLDDFSSGALTNWVYCALPGEGRSWRVENRQIVLSCAQLPLTHDVSGLVMYRGLLEISRTQTLQIKVDLISVQAPHPMASLSVGRLYLDPYTATDRPFIAHGRWLASTWWDAPIRMYDLEQAPSDGVQDQVVTHLMELGTPGHPFDLDFSADTNYVAVVGFTSNLFVGGFRTGVEAALASEWHTNVTGARFSPDSRFLAVSHRQGLDLLGTGDWQRTHPLGTRAAFDQPRFSPRGCRLAAVRDKREVRVWDLDNLPGSQEPWATFLHQADVRRLAFSPEGRYLVSSSTDGMVRLWDVIRRKAFGPPLPGAAARFSPDGTLLLVFGEEGGVWLWDLSRMADDTLAVPPLLTQQQPASSIDGTLNAEIVSRGIALTTPTGQYSLDHPVPLRRVAFTADDRYLIAESGDMRAWVWDVRARMLLGPPRPTLFDVSLTDHSLPALRVEDREPRRLSELAALLGGQRPDGVGGMMPLDDLERGQLFDELKKAHASEFKVDEADRERWHRRHAEEAERALDWDAAVFHWESVLRGKSEIRRQKAEISVEQRLAYARQADDIVRKEIGKGRSRWSVSLPRQPWAKPEMLDLDEFYNWRLGEPLVAGQPNASFRELPTGVQILGGTEFDVRGIIHLRLTNQVTVPLGRPCQRLHFLHAASQPAFNREQVGSYQVKYANGQKAVVTLLNPQDVLPYAVYRSSAALPLARTDVAQGLRSELAWEAYTSGSARRIEILHLTRTTWELPAEHRGKVVETLELQAGPAESAPLILAITIE